MEALSLGDFGAGDNRTDNTPAFNAAVARLLDRGGGRLYFPPGVWCFDSRIKRVARISLWGAGAAQNIADSPTVLRFRTANAGLDWEGDDGVHGNFAIDGSKQGTFASRVALDPCRWLTSHSTRTLLNLCVRYAARDGHVYQTAQNDIHIGCRYQNAGRWNGRWDGGCGGLTYIGCDFSGAESVGAARWEQTVNTGAYSYPTDITYDRCHFEYVATNNPTLSHAQGERITLTRCLIGQRFADYAGALVHQEDGATGALTLDSCQYTGARLSGNSAVHAGIAATQPLTVKGESYFNALSYCLDAKGNHKLKARDTELWTLGGGTALLAPGAQLTASAPVNYAR